MSLRSVTALGVVIAQIVAWAFPIPEYEEDSETGVGTSNTFDKSTTKMLGSIGFHRTSVKEVHI